MLGISQQTTAFAEAHGQSMALADDHKLICTTGEDSCRLYDLQTDPRELKNLAGRKPALEETLRNSLETWHSSHADYELRPVTTENGNGAWPKAIRGGRRCTATTLQRWHISGSSPGLAGCTS